jgi:hypothetical protein
MRQSFFKKEVSATGSQGTAKAEIIATMNYDSKVIAGTHPSTHDDFSKRIPVHKVEVFVNNNIIYKSLGIQSEDDVYSESERLIELAILYVENLATHKPVKTFGDKMTELFSEK